MPAPITPGRPDDPAQHPENPCFPFEQDEFAFYQALRADNGRAWNCLYIRATASFVPYVCQRSAVSLDDAYDLLQEGLAEFALKLRDGRYEYQAKPITAYVFIVCRNRWVSFLKRHKLAKMEVFREPVADDESMGAGYEATGSFSLTASGLDSVTTESTVADDLFAGSEVDWDAVSRAFSELGDDCRTLLQCFYVEGKSLKECGEAIGLQENSAKVKRFRCAQRLRTLYMNYRNDE